MILFRGCSLYYLIKEDFNGRKLCIEDTPSNIIIKKLSNRLPIVKQRETLLVNNFVWIPYVIYLYLYYIHIHIYIYVHILFNDDIGLAAERGQRECLQYLDPCFPRPADSKYSYLLYGWLISRGVIGQFQVRK